MMRKSLQKLIENIEKAHLTKDAFVTGIAVHSKEVQRGDLFLAQSEIHAKEAIQRGAFALATKKQMPFSIPQIICEDDIEGKIASSFYEHPSKALQLIGVTGTNGKTTTTLWLQYLLKQTLGPSGFIGTLHYDTGSCQYRATHTTPPSAKTHRLLHEMVQNGCRAAAMEVSSHALAQNRTDGLQFSTAIFTNLSQDHFDYHKTESAYFAAKAKLFHGLRKNGVAILNADCRYHKKIKTHAKKVTYSTQNQAHFTAKIQSASLEGMDVSFSKTRLTLPILGEYNVSNLLAAIAACEEMGIPFEALIPHLHTLPQVPGRLQRIPNRLGIHCFVDFAHTEHALHSLLSSLRMISKKHIILVFGCGGDRDTKKRTQMGVVAEKLSDHAIITNDNPRSESPLSIAKEIARGYRNEKKHTIILDRKEAIAHALKIAKVGDIVIIAGKGHENTQTIENAVLPFTDALIAKELCEIL